MNLGIEDKIAVVTGGSEGIGKAIALAFAKEGAKVAISARRKEELVYAAQKIREVKKTDTLSFVGDMSISGQVEEFFTQVITKWGTVHILVNNVGSARKALFDELREEDWHSTLATNLHSAIFCSRKAVSHMRRQKWGRIVNIGAISAKEPGLGLMASNVAKSSLLSFSKSLAAEVAGDGILVNCVCPGRILSAQTQRIHTAEERQKIALEHIPLGRFGKAEEVANLVVFLCSECASYITGTTIPVDGGFAKSLY
jgi:3-oxoacyl-[acyl-carrier protein] reductase